MGSMRLWIVLLLNGILLSIGCSPATLAMFVSPFVDNKLPPELSLTATKKEPTVAIMACFSQRLEDRREILPADHELAEKLAQHIRLRSQLNKEKIKLLPTSQVRSQQNKLGLSKGASPVEVGKQLQADFVIYLEIEAISLYEKKSYGDLYRGHADIAISVYDLDKPEGEQKVFDRPYRCEYPGSHPRDASSLSVIQFRALFLNRMAREISKMFVAYPADERTEME